MADIRNNKKKMQDKIQKNNFKDIDQYGLSTVNINQDFSIQQQADEFYLNQQPDIKSKQKSKQKQKYEYEQTIDETEEINKNTFQSDNDKINKTISQSQSSSLKCDIQNKQSKNVIEIEMADLGSIRRYESSQLYWDSLGNNNYSVFKCANKPDKSRERTKKQQKNNIIQYYLKDKNNNNEQNSYNIIRNKKDISDDIFNTSYQFKDSSFKWSHKFKNHLSLTNRKGICVINCQEKHNDEKNNYGNDQMNENKIDSNEDNNKHKLINNIINNNPEEIKLKLNQIPLDNLQSVQSYSEIMYDFLNSFHGNIFQELSCSFQQTIDRGSFGCVDLYLFQIESQFNNSRYHDSSNIIINNHINHNDNNLEEQIQCMKEQITNSAASHYLSNKFIQNQEVQNNNNNDPSNLNNINNNSLQQIKLNKHLNTTMERESQSQSNKSKSNTDLSILSCFLNQELYETKQEHQNNINTTFQLKQQLLVKPQKQIQTIPVAGKKVENLNEFIRELYIMQTVQSKYMPRLLGQDIDKQTLFLELGMCSLYDLKNESEKINFKFNDDLTYSILMNIIQAIESLLSYYNIKENKYQPLFHSDIKPQNIILTIRKNNHIFNQSNVKLLLIDFGGASFDLEDYWSYFTPAFVAPQLWNQFINKSKEKEQQSKEQQEQESNLFNWLEIRYAEIYAACRTVQFLIVENDKSYLFQKEYYSLFLQEYKLLYPKTCQILEKVYELNDISFIDSDYKNLFDNDMSILFQNQEYHLEIDIDQLYKMSKLFNIINLN